MNIKERVAVLDSEGQVVGEAYDVPEDFKNIIVAGAFTTDEGQTPINLMSLKVSRSKRNLSKARYRQPLSVVKKSYGDYWTFKYVKNNIVFYN